MESTYEYIKLSISIINTIIVLLIGLLINIKLNRNKNSLIIEREWQIKWADAFYDVGVKYNNTITDIVMEMFKAGQMSKENKNLKDNEVILSSVCL
jgi:hypothetical protein